MKSKHIYLAIPLLILLFGFGSFWSFVKWQRDHYFGKVQSIDGQKFTLVDDRIGVRTFTISDKTKIEKGKDRSVALVEGQDVVVIGTYNSETDMVTADIIRVLKKKNN
jgi:hypothetical protein